MKQTQKSKSQAKREEIQVTDMPEKVESDVLDGLDELLDEIDEVLEQNAEEFVNQYIQKGGQ